MNCTACGHVNIARDESTAADHLRSLMNVVADFLDTPIKGNDDPRFIEKIVALHNAHEGILIGNDEAIKHYIKKEEEKKQHKILINKMKANLSLAKK